MDGVSCVFFRKRCPMYMHIWTNCMNKLIWIAYLIGCNYVLPKSQLFKSFILWKYGNCLLSHVVNYEFPEELSWLKLFIVFFFLCLYGSTENRIELLWFCFWMAFLSSKDRLYLRTWNFRYFSSAINSGELFFTDEFKSMSGRKMELILEITAFVSIRVCSLWCSR